MSSDIKLPTPDEVQALTLSELRTYVGQVERTAVTKETRYLNRALRYTFTSLRKKLTPRLLSKIVKEFYPKGEEQMLYLDFLGPIEEMEVEQLKEETKVPNSKLLVTEVHPEVEIYLQLLLTVLLIDSKKYEEAVRQTSRLVEQLSKWNRRTLDSLSAKVYFYYARSHELVGKLAEIRPKLLLLQRTATLRHNFEGQFVLLNLLLRNYLHYNLYDQAEKFASKAEFNEQKVLSNEAARYYFYLGRINAVQLSYSSAYDNLQKALRKGPRETAKGFRSIVTKFSIIVQLLLGEIPERSTFRTEGIKQALKPYLELTQTVRAGSVADFQGVITKHMNLFKRDNTFLLVLRLRHNVIKTGLKRISSAYSRISFAMIAQKLNLDSLEDAEYVVAKAIRDGNIDATIDHVGGFMKSNDNVDVYATNEPEKAFNMRINFSLQIHNEAVKAMRYPPETWIKGKSDDSEVKEINEEDLAELFDGEDGVE
eukprot:TRINITY_DN8706_c0_g2_i8.p1 TRINITY_DN8706_c0_g2~~TRINITY_DN8706_c0_g2_i8.p1  ORF type:complete len:481 (+),score=100.59 TRINITY_DN8706_c0_g2_i8:113-1555(+)